MKGKVFQLQFLKMLGFAPCLSHALPYPQLKEYDLTHSENVLNITLKQLLDFASLPSYSTEETHLPVSPPQNSDGKVMKMSCI